MITIEMRSSVSQVLGLSERELKSLSLVLSYVEEGYGRTKRFGGVRKYLLNPDGTFPTGLIMMVEHWLLRNALYSGGTVHSLKDLRIKPRTGTLGLIQRCEEPAAYIDQLDAVQKCVASSSGRGIVTMPTGVGKSRVLKDIILQLDVPTLVVPPSANLRNQLYHYLKECFGSKYVGLYDKNVGCKKPITIANIDGLENGRPQHFKDFGCVIIDEFHHSAAATYRMVNEKLWGNIYYKFGMTATNFRNSPTDEILLHSVLHEEVFCMTPIEAINKGYITPIQAMIANVVNEDLEDTSVYPTCYKRFIVENAARNEIIIEYTNKMITKNVPSLVLVKQVEHGRFLSEGIKGSVFVNGQDENSDWNMKMVAAFNEGQVPCLIGTSVIGEGVDTKRAGLVALASGEKAKSRIMQNVGRVVRKFPGKNVGFVMDFMDWNSKTMMKHSLARQKIYKEEFSSSLVILR